MAEQATVTPERPSETTQRSTGSGRTLMESIADARRQKGIQTDQPPPSGVSSQVTVREQNQNAEGGPAGKGSSHVERRVQQPPPGDDPAVGTSADAMDILGRRMLGEERWQQRKDSVGKPAAKTEPKKQESTKDEEPPAGEDPKPTKHPVVTRTKNVQLTKDNLQSIIESATKAAVTASAPPKTATHAAQATDEDDGLTPRERSRLEVVAQMAKKDPDSYRALPQRFKEFAKTKKSYEAEWKKENNGQRFNWGDEQHREWLSNNSPEVEFENFADDFDDARIEIRAAAIAEQQLAKAKESIDSLRAQTVETSLRDKVKEQTRSVVKNWVSQFAPDSEWDLTTDEGRKAAIQEDKVFGSIAAQWAAELEAVTTEVVRIFDSKGTIKVDSENPYHRYLIQLSDVAEQRLSNVDPEETRNKSGQTFVTRAEYRAMSPEQRAKHYSILRDELIYLAENDLLQKAEEERQAELDKLEHVAKAQGWEFNRDSFTTRKKGKAKAEAVATSTSKNGQTPSEETAAPSSTSGKRPELRKNGDAANNEEFSSMMMSRLFPRDNKE